MTATARVVIVDCGSARVPAIDAAVVQSGATTQVIHPPALPAITGSLPDAIIISGNPALIADTGSGFLTSFSNLKKLELPILGICFGHQLIGMLFGAGVSLGKEDRSVRRIERLRDTPLFAGLSCNDEFQEDHIEHVGLPEGFIHLATSTHCDNEAMMHPERPIFGVQFHPESSGVPGRQLIDNFLGLC